jgi:hypothetical protein
MESPPDCIPTGYFALTIVNLPGKLPALPVGFHLARFLGVRRPDVSRRPRWRLEVRLPPPPSSGAAGAATANAPLATASRPETTRSKACQRSQSGFRRSNTTPRITSTLPPRCGTDGRAAEAAPLILPIQAKGPSLLRTRSLLVPVAKSKKPARRARGSSARPSGGRRLRLRSAPQKRLGRLRRLCPFVRRPPGPRQRSFRG